MTLTKSHADAIIKLCPKFIRCLAPICPLDFYQDDRDYIKGEPKCRLSKSKRIKIAEGTDLHQQGLTKREFAAKKAWESLSEPDKAERRSKLCLKGPFRSISSDKIDPPSKGRDNIPLLKETGDNR